MKAKDLIKELLEFNGDSEVVIEIPSYIAEVDSYVSIDDVNFDRINGSSIAVLEIGGD